MSQIKFDKPLQVNLTFSLQHKVFLYLIQAAAIIILLLPFKLHIAIKIIIVSYVIFSFIYISSKTKTNYAGFLNHVDENTWLWTNDDSGGRFQFRYGIILFPQLVLLTFCDKKGENKSWLFFPDSLDKDTFRKIRILVRHSTAETISPPV